MQADELYTLLKTTGLPVAYHAFKKPPSLPYLVYLFTFSDNFGADNKVHSRADVYQVELYTVKKDPVIETKLEAALDGAELYWDKSETFIESEDMYQILYEIEI